MNLCYRFRALALLAPFIASCTLKNDQSTAKEGVVYEGRTMRVVVPSCPLAEGSIRIEPKGDVQHFSAWKNENHHETYAFVKKIQQVWAQQGFDALVYEKESTASTIKFGWEVVPFHKTNSWIRRVWNQFWVLWSTIFGGSCLGENRLQLTAAKIREQMKFAEPFAQEGEVKEVEEKCAFCNPEVIEKQSVFKGKTVQVIYNYAPITIGKDALHFLILPLRHAKRFSDLTEEEYREASDLSQKLICHYRQEGINTAYLYNKSGKDAGQTVPHWHQHLVFTASKTDEFFVKLRVLKNMVMNMVWRSSPLSDAQLKTRVEGLRGKLSGLSEQPSC